MEIQGKVFKYGNHIDTDVIIPARYLNTSDPKELAKHCMEDIDQNFIKEVQQGDFIVAQENFGCGSSREHAPIAIKASGISCVIADSFARIFYRNAFNIGLPILESENACKNIKYGDILSVDLTKGIIKNITKDELYYAQPIPKFMQEMINIGGLVNYVKKKLNSK
ncbi:3-isopropylmalate dehydratase small subunit [Garciella nitratireducens]|uniref:3-isopropylmalate dehydratase small subunit n=1 Tax=Garciella nitratireducens TaxID=218205 RepID=UPI000DEBA76D|nr:3-isopropylmalate dehydratase small subunit [Garciella nitratireducens]RBP44988.1 3-isopropylmalate/(R)-2-methylmalate dehydratase small subunit [Garciella nitratireducens]